MNDTVHTQPPENATSQITRTEIHAQLGTIEWLGYVLCLLIGGLLVTLSAGSWLAKPSAFGPALFTLGFGMVVSLAAATTGGVLGFLFGIPRLSQRYSPDKLDNIDRSQPQNSIKAGYLLSNSNLESISDWLTNILVGLGLIHLTQFPAFFLSYRGWLSDGLATSGVSDPMSVATAMVLLTIAVGAGSFLFFYLQTRTRVTLLLSDTEAARAGDVKFASAGVADQFESHAARASASTSTIAKQSLRAAKALQVDAEVLSKPPTTNDNASYWASWAAANARNENYNEAEAAWRIAIVKSPAEATYRTQFGDVLQAQGKFSEAVQEYDKALQLGGFSKRVLLGKLLAALYDEDEKLADVAIEAAEQLYSKPYIRRDPWVKLWRICAYAQKFVLLDEEDPKRKDVRESVKSGLLELTRQVPDPEHDIRIFLRQLLEPSFRSGDPTENDLAVFANDKEIVDIIRSKTPVKPSAD